jgi:hypothetical protein
VLTNYIMHRTQILLEPELYRRAVRTARARKSSLGELVREALEAQLAREEGGDPVVERLTRDPYDDPKPNPHLSVDVDHHLYGAPRRSRAKR